MAGDIPYIIRGVQEDLKALYYSDPNAALKVPVTFAAGYGVLKKGTAVALNLSAAGNTGLLVPYNPNSFTGAASENHPGRAYLVADVGAAANTVYVNVEDSYKFAVGDDLIINDNATSAENLGAITAIDRTTYGHMAGITVTTATTGTFEVTAYGHVLVEAGTSGNNYSDCVGILEKSIDTGLGSNAKGAVATLILRNAVLYAGVLENVDSAARTDISASLFGQYLYF